MGKMERPTSIKTYQPCCWRWRPRTA